MGRGREGNKVFCCEITKDSIQVKGYKWLRVAAEL